jgi:SAM-dependent methyltransferase
LDIGSGDGKRITGIFKGKSRITAVDESPSMCKILRENKYIEKVVESSVESLDSHTFNKKFDLVTMQWNVLGHLPTHNSIFRFFNTVLKPGGALIFDVNNPLNFRSYGFRSVLENVMFFYVYPREKRKLFLLSHANYHTQVSFSPVSYYLKLLKHFGFVDTKLKYFDYDDGLPAGPFTGQITFDSIKP